MYSPLLLFLFVLSSSESCPELDNFPGDEYVPLSPEKRVARAKIAVKALMTGRHPDPAAAPGAFVAELWILDVYKGAEKLAASLGVLGGSKAAYHLKDK